MVSSLDGLAFAFQRHFGGRQFTSSQGDVCIPLRRQERNPNLYSNIKIVPLKFLKEVLEIIEFRKQAIFADQVD